MTFAVGAIRRPERWEIWVATIWDAGWQSLQVSHRGNLDAVPALGGLICPAQLSPATKALYYLPDPSA